MKYYIDQATPRSHLGKNMYDQANKLNKIIIIKLKKWGWADSKNGLFFMLFIHCFSSLK
jgi:hypothetical protein